MRTETRDTIVLTAGTGATALMSLIYLSIAGRMIDAARFGDFTGATAFIALCTLALGPINGTVAKFTAQYTARAQFGRIVALYRAMSRRVARYGALAFGIGLLVLLPLSRFLQFESVWPLLLAYVAVYLTVLLCVFRGVLRGVQRYGLLKINTFVESVVRLGSGALLLWLFASVAAGLSAYIVALGVIVIVARWQIRGILADHQPQSLDGAAIRRFSVPIFAMMLTSAALQNADMLFVKARFDELQAGTYGAAFGLARTVGALFTPFNIMMLPLMTTLYEQKSATGGAFVRVCVYFLILVSLPLFVFAVWPNVVVAGMYGNKYAGASGLLFLITLTRVVGFFGHLIGLTFLSRDDYRFLWWYVPCLFVQLVAMYRLGTTPRSLIIVVLVVQTGAALLLAAGLVVTTRRRTRANG